MSLCGLMGPLVEERKWWREHGWKYEGCYDSFTCGGLNGYACYLLRTKGNPQN